MREELLREEVLCEREDAHTVGVTTTSVE